tara:strand:+ start:57 stop:242 length:186 start_codon:yes stop_codon:yes gene_type:complete
MPEVTIEVKVKRGDKIEKSLRILKRKMLKEGILDTVKNKRYFVSNSEKKKIRNKKRRFNNG